MARYILIATVAGSPGGSAYRTFPRGTIVASDAESAEWPDVVWPELCVAPNTNNMRPFDSAASAVMGLPIMTLAELATSSIGGP